MGKFSQENGVEIEKDGGMEHDCVRRPFPSWYRPFFLARIVLALLGASSACWPP